MQIVPRFVLDEIEDLGRVYPPRCIKPGETLEDHLRYAGKVELVRELRIRFQLDEV